ncbi:MAG: exo-alpha-sialidase [Thermoplasmata archaeon]|nr:MAG: exo-alpha-sialidase [Thermoplasmata archaeon]
MAIYMPNLKQLRQNCYQRIIIIISISALIFISQLPFISIPLVIQAENFGNNIRVDDTKFGITNQTRPDIAIHGNEIYVVWEDNRLSGIHNTNIFFAKSTDNGKSFQTNVRVDNAPIGAATNPSMALDESNGNIFIVWQDYRNSPDPYSIDIYCANSTDGGNSFGINKRVIDETGNNWQNVPSIAARNGFIGITWEDQRGGIYFANSTDGGNTFGENKRVNDVLGSIIYYSKIAIDSKGIIYVVWEDNPSGETRIHFSKSLDGGNTWAPSKKVDDDALSEGQRMPDIALDSNDNIYVVWRDKKDGDWDIYFTNSSDGGDYFSSSVQVSEDFLDEAQFHPSIAVSDEGKIFVTWLEDKDFPNQENVSDIYFTNSTDSGIIFNPKQKINIGPSFSAVYTPSNAIAAKGNHAYIVWQDDRKGDWDIYFTRSNWEPPMATPISPPIGSKLALNEPNIQVDTVFDPDNDTIYFNFTISDQPDAESGTIYYSGWITSTSWKPPLLSDGKWYWHTYTNDGFNITPPNWVWNFTIDTSQGYSVQLYEGWNLISIPFIQTDTDICSVLSSIDGSYDAVQCYNVRDNSDHWKHHQISKPSHLNDLESIDHTMGFWIHVTKPGGVLFQCSGIIPTKNQSITLKTGWNLVGYPSLNNRTRTLALNNLTIDLEVDAIWTYNASIQKWEQIGEFDYFERGRGYWVHAKTNCLWEVPL